MEKEINIYTVREVILPRKEINAVLTNDLALKVNAVARNIPNDFPFYSLVARPESFHRPDAIVPDILSELPQEWTDLMENLSRIERIKIENALNRLSRGVKNLRDLGSARNALARNITIPKLSMNRRNFLLLALKKNEETGGFEQPTLGLI